MARPSVKQLFACALALLLAWQPSAMPLEMKVLLAQGDYEKPLQWLQEHAAAGDQDAQFDLARMLRSGPQTIRNAERSQHWLQTAAGSGHSRAIALLQDIRDSSTGGRAVTPSSPATNCADRDPMGNSPLHRAVSAKQAESVQALLSKSCNVNLRNRNGVTPLHIGIANDDEHIIAMLLRAGADTSLTDRSGWDAIELAKRRDYAPVLALLNVSMPSPTTRGVGKPAPLRLAHALNTGNRDMALQAITDGARWWRFSAAGVKPEDRQFLAAFQGDHDSLLSEVIDASGNPPDIAHSQEKLRDLTVALLKISAKAGQGQTFKRLLAFARPDTDTIAVAQKSRCEPCLLELAALAAAKPNALTWPADTLLATTQGRMWTAAQAILSSVPLVSETDEDGRTALWWTARNGPEQLARSMVAAGSDVNQQDQTGKSPIHIAVEEGAKDTAMFLIQHHLSEVDLQSNTGTTPLMLAATRPERAELVSALLGARAEVDLRNDSGDTALILSIRADNLQATRALIQAQATVGIRNAAGVSARDLLEAHADPEFQALLEEIPGLLDRLVGHYGT